MNDPTEKRCDHCGRRKHADDAWHTYPSTDRVWHSECMGFLYWRNKAEERLRVLRTVVDAWGVTKADVVALLGVGAAPAHMDIPTPRTAEEASLDDLAFRVFYDIEHGRHT